MKDSTRRRALYRDRIQNIFSASVGEAPACNQFYFDGNKRTGRLMMNGLLMSSGLDAIVTPARRKADYNRGLRDLFTYGDARPYIAFTLSCYDG